MIPALVQDWLRLGPEALGSLWSVMALGTVIGALISARIPQKLHEPGMLSAWLAYGVLTGCLAMADEGYGFVLTIAFAMGCTGALADVLFAIIVQCETPNTKVSKTFATFSTLANSGEALSAPILAMAIGLWGIGGAFIAGAVLPVCASIIGLALVDQARQPADR